MQAAGAAYSNATLEFHGYVHCTVG